MSTPERIAAIDIGSDTIHLLIGSIAGTDDGPTVKRIRQDGDLLLLGGRVATKGRIGERASADLQKSLIRLVTIARRRSDRLVIGATEALRRAQDGPDIVERLGKAAGEPVRILSGAREAELGFSGILHRLEPTGAQLVVDSGGASTELTLTDGRRKVAAASLPVGAALLGAGLHGDPPEALSWALRAQQIGAALAAAPDGKPVRAWATGGSAHNLAGLERTRGRSGPQRLTMSGLGVLASRLLAVPSRKLAKRSGEDPGRVAILPPGLLIIAAVMEHYDLESLTVVPEGLRDGMILAAAAQGDDWWRDQPVGSGAPSSGGAPTSGGGAPTSHATRPRRATAARPTRKPAQASPTPPPSSTVGGAL